MGREKGICVIGLSGVDTPDHGYKSRRNDRVLIEQEAKLTQRDRASILSVEIM